MGLRASYCFICVPHFRRVSFLFLVIELNAGGVRVFCLFLPRRRLFNSKVCRRGSMIAIILSDLYLRSTSASVYFTHSCSSPSTTCKKIVTPSVC